MPDADAREKRGAIPEPAAVDLVIDLKAEYTTMRVMSEWPDGNVHIAARARTLVPALIRRLAAAEAEVERLRALLPSFPPGSLEIREPVKVERPDGTFDVTYRFAKLPEPATP